MPSPTNTNQNSSSPLLEDESRPLNGSMKNSSSNSTSSNSSNNEKTTASPLLQQEQQQRQQAKLSEGFATQQKDQPQSPNNNNNSSGTSSSKLGNTAFRMTMFVLTTAFVTLNGVSFPLALSGNTDMTSFSIYTQILYSLIFAFMDCAMEFLASFMFPTSPIRSLEKKKTPKKNEEAPVSKEQLQKIVGRQQRRRWLVRGAAEWYDSRHFPMLGFLMACNALMSTYGGSADRTPLTIQAAMNLLTNILGVRLKVTVFGLNKELPWFSLSKFNKYYYGSGLCFLVACVLTVIDRIAIAKVPDGQFGPLAILYALGNIALVVYIVELDKMLADADAEKKAMKRLQQQQQQQQRQANCYSAPDSLLMATTHQRSARPAAAPYYYDSTLETPQLSPKLSYGGTTTVTVRSEGDADNLYKFPAAASGADVELATIDMNEVHEQHFDEEDEPRSALFKLYAHVHRTVALLRRVQFATMLFLFALSLFALIPGLDQAGTISMARLEATICPMLGMDNLYINLFNIAVVFGFITSTILNEIDASLVMTSANASQIMQLAVGWLPVIGPLAVGYFPNIPLTLVAIALSVLGVWCAQRYSVEMGRIIAEKEEREKETEEAEAEEEKEL